MFMFINLRLITSTTHGGVYYLFRREFINRNNIGVWSSLLVKYKKNTLCVILIQNRVLSYYIRC